MTRFAISIATLLIAASAYADGARKIDFTQPIIAQDGKPYTQCVKVSDDKKTCVDSAPVTLGDLALVALNSVGGDAKTQILTFRLIQAVSGAKDAELSGEDTKRLVDALWQWRQQVQQRDPSAVPLYEVGQAVQMIDPASLK
jgi:hypothetical protein